MIVIDTSVMGKWVLDDEESTEDALLLLNNHTGKKEGIIVPELIFYEIANALATKSKITPKRSKSALIKIYSLKLQIYHPNDKDVIEAARLAKKYKTSVYDMLFAVVAKNHKINLITADEQFVKQTKFEFVKLL